MSLITDFFRTMRPHQWVKNLFIFPALIFSKHLFQPDYLLRSLAAFVLFCALSGSVYIFNDIMDAEEDRHHPKKKDRPIAAGRVSARTALAAFIIVAALSISLSFILEMHFGIIAAAYFLINVGYSVYLKRVALVDVLVVSLGFVIRAAAGGLAIEVEVSPWLLVCTMLLALFLVLAKRRHELTLLDERQNTLAELSPAEDENTAIKYRKSLDEYSAYFLDQMIALTTASTLMAYILYTLSREAAEKFGGTALVYTTPFVIYGIFRYLYLIHQKNKGGSPTKTLMGDGPLLVDVGLWGMAVVFIVYFYK